MRLFNKIAIIGVGLIGGSIGLGVKKKALAEEVIGVFRRPSTLKKAVRLGAVDRGTLDLRSGVKDADLIILATPVISIPRIAKDVIEYAKRGAILTDVGSTKKWIVGEIERMLGPSKKIFFVGSHPMAGSEHAGVEFAKIDLLEGSPCIVTKTNKTDKNALTKVAAFWGSVGAKVDVMSPLRHDRSASLISHLPHIVAFSLAGAVPRHEMRYAAEGFKDTTRVASSDPKVWTDIFVTNKKEILRSARIFESHYKKLIKILSGREPYKLSGLLKKIKTKRDTLSYGRKG